MMVNDKRMSPEKIKYNCKLQVQKYVESFFTGDNKKYMIVSSPSLVNYNIEHSSIESQNVKEKKLQIARYFNELKNVLPAILVLDGNMKNIPQSFNSVTNSFGSLKNIGTELTTCREIEVGILIGSTDQQTTDELVTSVSFMFNELRQFGGGNLIVGDKNKGENWAINLPLSGLSFGSIQEQAISSDAIDKIYYSEASLTIFYEDKILFESSGVDFKASNVKVGSPKIVIDDTISFERKTKLIIDRYNPELTICSDNYKTATIGLDGYITPRSLGKFKIIVKNKRGETLDEKEVEVV